MNKNTICAKLSPIFEKLGNIEVKSAEQLELIRLSNSELVLIKKRKWQNYKLSSTQRLVIAEAKKYAQAALRLRKNQQISARNLSRQRARPKIVNNSLQNSLLAQDFEENMTQMSFA